MAPNKRQVYELDVRRPAIQKVELEQAKCAPSVEGVDDRLKTTLQNQVAMSHEPDANSYLNLSRRCFMFYSTYSPLLSRYLITGLMVDMIRSASDSSSVFVQFSADSRRLQAELGVLKKHLGFSPADADPLPFQTRASKAAGAVVQSVGEGNPVSKGLQLLEYFEWAEVRAVCFIAVYNSVF